MPVRTTREMSSKPRRAGRPLVGGGKASRTAIRNMFLNIDVNKNFVRNQNRQIPTTERPVDCEAEILIRMRSRAHLSRANDLKGYVGAFSQSSPV